MQVLGLSGGGSFLLIFADESSVKLLRMLLSFRFVWGIMIRR